MIEVRRSVDVAGFLAEAGAFLTDREAEHNLIFGLCSQLRVDPGTFGGAPYLRVALDGDRVVAVAFRTPPHNLILSEVDDAEAIDAMARDARATFDSLPGVLGPPEAASAFAHRWRELTQMASEQVAANRIYRASEAQLSEGVDGAMRTYEPADRSTVLAWLDAFADEALAHDTVRLSAETILARRERDPDGALMLWGSVTVPVSLAGYGGPTPNGIRVGPVYTPPELRGRGYASALVGAMTAMLLGRGYRFCFLFTDLANPTSNRLYQRVGYRPVTDVHQYRFV